jgi:hypothetical protein
MGGQTAEQLHSHEKRDIKDAKPRRPREYYLQQQQKTERKRTPQILFLPTAERSKHHGCRLYVHRRKGKIAKERSMFRMQTNQASIKGLSKQKEKVHTLPDTKHPAEDERKGTPCPCPILANPDGGKKNKEEIFDDTTKEGF